MWINERNLHSAMAKAAWILQCTVQKGSHHGAKCPHVSKQKTIVPNQICHLAGCKINNQGMGAQLTTYPPSSQRTTIVPHICCHQVLSSYFNNLFVLLCIQRSPGQKGTTNPHSIHQQKRSLMMRKKSIHRILN